MVILSRSLIGGMCLEVILSITHHRSFLFNFTTLRCIYVTLFLHRHPEFGKQGKVKVVMRETMRAIVENINLREKELPADPERGTKAETVMEENSVHYSTLNLVDPVTGFPTKINWSYLEDGTKVRISKRSGAIIPKPVHKKTLSYTVSEDSDTLKVEDVWAETYVEKVSKWEDMRNELLKMEKKRLEE